MSEAQKDLVLYFLRQGDWSQAVAFLREETGLDCDSAEAVVFRVAAVHGIRRWSLRWAILGVLSGTAGLIALWAVL